MVAKTKVRPLTEKEVRVAETLRAFGRPVSAYDIISKINDKGLSAPPTVYRALNRLIAEAVYVGGEINLDSAQRLLKDMLRAHANGTDYHASKTYAETLGKVVENIRRRIDYADKVTPEARVRFLQAFYNAQRAYLEQRQLFGDRRSDKFFDAKEDETAD